MTTKLKSCEEWAKGIAYGGPNHYKEMVNLIRIEALEAAVEIVRDYANTMRGAHVNTNDSCGVIRRALLTQIEELKKK